MKREEVLYEAKHHWTDSKCYIAALFILGIIGFSSAAVMVYTYLHGFAGVGNSAAIASGNGIMPITQHFGSNFDPTFTRTLVMSNPERDPFSGAFTCPTPSGQPAQPNEQFEVQVNACVTATCTCTNPGSTCPNNDPTCCVDKNGNTCTFGQENCLMVSSSGDDLLCTCNNNGGGSSCCLDNSCGNCNVCTDINSNTVCAGASYEIAGDACGTFQCVCGSGDPCTANARTCCIDKDGATCNLNSSGCKGEDGNTGDVLDCTCNGDGNLVDCTGPPPEFCPDKDGNPTCAMDQPGCLRIINGNEYSCTCSYNAAANQFVYSSCTPTSGGGGGGGSTPTSCPGSDGSQCPLGQPGCPRTINGSPYLCVCNYDADTNQYTYTQCYSANDPCNGQGSCTAPDGSTKCIGDSYSFPHPNDPCFTCTCTCGQGSCSCPYTCS